MSSGYGYGDYSSKRRRGNAPSRSRSDRRGEEKRVKGEKKTKKDKKNRERIEVEEVSKRKRLGRSRSRDHNKGGGGGGNGREVHGHTPSTATVQQQAAAGGHAEEAALGRTASRGAPAAASHLLDQTPRQQSKWREEITKADPVALLASEDAEDDDAAIERTLSESRRRREVLIAKWVNRGEAQNGTLDLETPLGAEESESEGEVSDDNRPAEEVAKDPSAEKPDEETLKQKRAVQKWILEHKAEHDDDMFLEDADEAALKGVRRNQSQAISQTGASADDWDDNEGYYKAKIGEVMANRYYVEEDMCGKGVFSNVVKARDQEANIMVAVKIMRCNDMMRQAAEKEVEVLERLSKADRHNKKHVIRLLRHFMYRGHLCLVFECMWDNLRVALKKYTKDRGMSLHAVRSYTKQLLVALRHVHRCQIIHGDIKPDNILISEGHNVVKICDLGSGMDTTDVDITPYLVSRFYRAPEIVLGKEYGVPIDIFSLGCTLYELFTAKILFPGRTNNDMLRLFMEVKGKIPHRVIKSGQFWKNHFDENLDFKYLDTNKATRKKITRVVTDCSQKRAIVDMVLNRVGPEKQKSAVTEDQLYVKKAKQFADLMEKMTALDPDRRINPNDALQHPFVVEAFHLPGSKEAAKHGGIKGGTAGNHKR